MFHKKIRTETYFSKERFRGRFRQKRAKFLPWNDSHNPFSPENRWGGDFIKTFRPETCFWKNDFEGVLGKSEWSFRLETHHIIRLAPKIGGEGGGFVKKYESKTCFLEKKDFGGVLGKSKRSFRLETRYIVRLAPKIGEGGGFIKKFGPEMCFSEEQFWGCFRQKRVKSSPQNTSHSLFGPENRWGGDFVKKFRPKMCFLE